MISNSNMIIEVITADITHLSENLLEEHSIRLYSRGGHFNKEQMLPVYFMLITGYSDDDSYNNFLYSLRDDIKKTHRPFAFIDTPLNEPGSGDRILFSGIDRSSDASVISGLCSQINLKGDVNRSLIAQKALGDMLSLSRTDAFEAGMSLVVKLNLIANAIETGSSDQIPIIMYYGIPSTSDVLFLCFAQRCGFDVICISPDKAAANVFKLCPFADKIQKEELPNSKPVMPFPSRMIKAKIATVAYNAERELDTMLYNGDTMFRSRQFSKLESAVLKTTFEEIEILWNQEAKFRSGFAVRGDTVIVPTIFAKISGVFEEDIKDYWEYVEYLLTPQSIYIIKTPSYKRPNINVARIYAPFHNGPQININALRQSQLNKYGFLSEELQILIFEKIQAVINDGLLEIENPAEMVDYAMYTGLNLDKRVLRLLQQYDFTKEIPKIVVVDAIEEPFSKLECTQLLLFSYLGFDIVIASPSGYRNIETFVSEDAFETHTFSEFKYNVSVPRFKIPSSPRIRKRKGGLFKNLFKKGR